MTMELETGGVHIGWVSSYWMDRDCNWIARDALCPGQEAFLVLGLDICESRFWSRGLGKRALTAWILYFLQNGARDLYLQTWSGHLAMIRVAERLGFREFRRKTAQRLVREERYDGLTFRLELASFGRYLLEENLRDLRLSAGTERNVGEAYDKRPGFYAAWAETAYEGEAPDLPICRQSPMERLVFWCLHMTRARLQYQAKGFRTRLSQIRSRTFGFGRTSMRPNTESRACPERMWLVSPSSSWMHLSAGILAVSAVSDDLSGRRGMRRGVYDLFSGTEKAAAPRSAGDQCARTQGGGPVSGPGGRGSASGG